MDVFSPQCQSCPTSLRSSLSTQNHLSNTLCKVCPCSLPLHFGSIVLFVRSHSTEETCKGVRVQKDASDSWFDSMSHIFSFSWPALFFCLSNSALLLPAIFVWFVMHHCHFISYDVFKSLVLWLLSLMLSVSTTGIVCQTSQDIVTGNQWILILSIK